MREILFRGKRLDNGKWVEGNLFIPDKVTRADVPTEILMGTNIVRISFEVDPYTVGQYTGLTDKNGAKIFEGDVVRHNDGTLHEVVFEQRSGNAYFGWTMNELETWHFDGGFLRQLEVIGNIHDNPKLLEVQL